MSGHLQRMALGGARRSASLPSWNLIASNTTATTNPNGVYSFIRKSSATSTTANLLTYAGTPGQFQGPDGFSTPLCQFLSATNLFLHPGLSAANQVVGVRWTSPVTGNLVVSGTYFKQNTGTSDGVRVSVQKNNTTTVVSPTLITPAAPNFSYSLVPVSVVIGDVLDFVIQYNANANADHTTVSLLQIAQV
jgi:hypothetical protein